MTGWFSHGAVQAAGGAAPAFSPTDITGLELWLDASDAGTITDTAGEVSQWDDKSAQGNDVVQATSGNQGNTSTINTNDGIFFDGTGERMRDTPGSVTSPPGTLVAVFTPTSVAAGVEDVLRFRATFNNTLRLSRSADDIRASEGTGGATTVLLIANTLTVNETRWAIFRARNSGDGTSDLLDDAAGSTSTSLAASISDSDDINVAANADGTDSWTGHIHELIYYNRFITDTERTNLAAYLNGKWSL